MESVVIKRVRHWETANTRIYWWRARGLDCIVRLSLSPIVAVMSWDKPKTLLLREQTENRREWEEEAKKLLHPKEQSLRHKYKYNFHMKTNQSEHWLESYDCISGAQERDAQSTGREERHLFVGPIHLAYNRQSVSSQSKKRHNSCSFCVQW